MAYIMIGMDFNGVNKIESALENYITALTKHNISISTAELHEYMKGPNAEKTFQSLINKINTDVDNYIKGALNPLKSAVQDAKKLYSNADASSTSLNASIKNLKS